MNWFDQQIKQAFRPLDPRNGTVLDIVQIGFSRLICLLGLAAVLLFVSVLGVFAYNVVKYLLS